MVLELPGGETALVPLVGNTAIDVFFEGAEGVADDDTGNGEDEVDTEIVAFQLSGFHPSLGPVDLGLNSKIPSVGRIEEQANNTPGLLDVDPFAPGDAITFHDMFFRLDLAETGNALTTAGATRLGGVIEHKPPNNGELLTFTPRGVIELINVRNGQPSGIALDRRILALAPRTQNDALPNVVEQLVVETTGGTRTIVPLVGTASIAVYFEGSNVGAASDHDGNGLGEVVAEMTSFDLVGFDPLFGPVTMSLRSDYPSIGVIEEQVSATPGLLDVGPFAGGDANSFFDVFFETELPRMAATLTTVRPTRLAAIFEHLPPESGERLVFAPPQPIELVDATGTATGGLLIKRAVDPAPTVEHDSYPATTMDLLVDIGAGAEFVRVAGSSQVDVFFEGPAEGNATDDDDDGRDEVVQQIVGLALTGTSSQGPIAVTLSATGPSLGLLAEESDATPGLLDVDPFSPGDAVSTFHFDPRIWIGGDSMLLEAPATVTTTIVTKPATDGIFDYHPGSPVMLIDGVTGQPTGMTLRSFRLVLNGLFSDGFEGS